MAFIIILLSGPVYTAKPIQNSVFLKVQPLSKSCFKLKESIMRVTVSYLTLKVLYTLYMIVVTFPSHLSKYSLALSQVILPDI